MCIDFKTILPTGRKNGISAERLRARIGAKSVREVRKQIEAARLSGQLICSGNEGYWLPADKSEIRAFIERSEAEAKGIYARLKTARAALKAMNTEPDGATR